MMRCFQSPSPAVAAAAVLGAATVTHCWNCGRPGTETCSGCNVARYCSQFCQHKDWEGHHKVCATTLSVKKASGAVANRDDEKEEETKAKPMATSTAVATTSSRSSSGSPNSSDNNTNNNTIDVVATKEEEEGEDRHEDTEDKKN